MPETKNHVRKLSIVIDSDDGRLVIPDEERDA